MKWVGQGHPDGCLLACIAMVIGESYDGVAATFPKVNIGGFTYHVVYETLNARGFVYQHFYKYDRKANSIREPWPLPPWAPVHICGVDAGRGGAASHGVVLLPGGMVLDPATEQPRRMSDYPDCGYMIGIWEQPPQRGGS